MKLLTLIFNKHKGDKSMKLRNMKFLALPTAIVLNLALCGTMAFGAVTTPDEGPGAPEQDPAGG